MTIYFKEIKSDWMSATSTNTIQRNDCTLSFCILFHFSSGLDLHRFSFKLRVVMSGMLYEPSNKVEATWARGKVHDHRQVDPAKLWGMFGLIIPLQQESFRDTFDLPTRGLEAANHPPPLLLDSSDWQGFCWLESCGRIFISQWKTQVWRIDPLLVGSLGIRHAAELLAYTFSLIW